jgi:thymidylate synthase (FAD)
MAHSVPIKIFIIGETRANLGAMDQWLKYHDSDPKTVLDACETDMEAVIGLAAKRCYLAFEPGANRNVTRVRRDWVEYFDNILASGHGSVLEHAVYNIVIEGCTRVFTAEMNRHRAGVGISEGSLRYIRLDDLPFWMPLSIRLNLNDDAKTTELKRRLQASLIDSFIAAETKIRKFCEDLCIDSLPFDEKKKWTSMLRRFIPLGVSTGGTWTLNIRALRHIMTMRSSEHAEEEIAYVMSLIAKKIFSKQPNLFGDFTEDENGFWRPKYVKV